MKNRLRKIRRLLKGTIAEWQTRDVSLLASALAYSTVFSLAPLMILIIRLVGAFFGEAAAEEQIVAQLTTLVGEEGAQLIATAIANMRSQAGGGTIQVLVNLGVLAFGATGVFAQIQSALNRIWEVKPVPERRLFQFLRKRLLSFTMILIIAFLLLVSSVASAFLVAAVEALTRWFPALATLWQLSSLIASFGVAAIIFAMLYRILPDVEIAWRDATIGAIITALLFVIGQSLFGWFLNVSDFGSAYGVAGSFVIIITWIFYAAQILFLGAAFTKVFAQQRGTPIVPSEFAVPKDDRAE